MAERILIVEDDAKISELLTANLAAAGFDCHRASDGVTGLQDFDRLAPHLLILDLGLPKLDGLELLRRVRERDRTPVLVLSARESDGDKVLGFELGADDYVTKPFSVVELVARVRALLRRSGPRPIASLIAVGNLEIDASSYAVRRSGTAVEVTSLEFDLLHFLASHAGNVFSREQLMNQVWGEDRVVDTRSIDSLVSRLRRKLEVDPSKPRYLQTVWGAGYRFAQPEDD